MAACAEQSDTAPDRSPPGGGKTDDATCSSTCPVACSDGVCAVPTQVVSGAGHSCARLDDGSVWCWGSDWEGQLGLALSGYPGFSCSNGTSSTPCRRNPHRIEGLPPVKELAAGRNHTCAILEDETARCWGSNFASVLGIGDRVVSTCNVVGVMVPCLKSPNGDPGLMDVAEIAAGEHSTCALTTDGDVWCWGTNGNGQLGSYRFATTVPVLVPSLSNVKSIAAGRDHSCAVMSDDTVQCWGKNTYGQVGDGTASDWHWTPSEVVGLSDVSQLALGERFSCALRFNGDVHCWGGNISGELGRGTFVSSLVPVKVPSLSNVEEIDAAFWRACARTPSGVQCWGLGGLGLGFQATTPCPNNASYKCAAEPGLVTGLENATQLALSAMYGCALTSDDHISCWGDNLFGTLGNDTSVGRMTPERVEW